jgi:hypothetical protein
MEICCCRLSIVPTSSERDDRFRVPDANPEKRPFGDMGVSYALDPTDGDIVIGSC